MWIRALRVGALRDGSGVKGRLLTLDAFELHKARSLLGEIEGMDGLLGMGGRRLDEGGKIRGPLLVFRSQAMNLSHYKY